MARKRSRGKQSTRKASRQKAKQRDIKWWESLFVIVGGIATVAGVIATLYNVFDLGPQPASLPIVPVTQVATSSPVATPTMTTERGLVLIAEFSGEPDYKVEERIAQHLADIAVDNKVPDVRVKLIRETVMEGSEDAAEELGSRYGAQVIVWGWYDSFGLKINLTVLEREGYGLRFDMPEIPIDSKDPGKLLREDVPTGVTYIVLVALGQIYYAEGDYSDSVKAFDQAIGIDPQQHFAYYGRGKAYDDLEQYERAIQDLRKALEMKPDFAAAHYVLGNALSDSSHYEEAIKEYGEAIRLDPAFMQAYGNRGWAYLKSGQPGLALQDFATTIELGETQKNQEIDKAYDGKCVAHYDLEQYAEALRDCNTALELNPTNGMAYVNRGNVHRHLGNLEHALADYAKAIEIGSDLAGAYAMRGQVYLDLERYDKAVEDLDTALQLDSKQLEPHLSNTYALRGIAHRNLGNLEQALSDFNEALKLKPDLAATIYIYRADVYASLARYDEARQDAGIALELTPRDQEALLTSVYARLGEVNSDLGNLEQALSDYNTTLELDPNLAEVYVNRGNVYYRQKKYDMAVHDYDVVVQTLPEETATCCKVEAYYNRGLAEHMLGNLEQAIKDYSAAIDLDVNYARAYKARGVAYLDVPDRAKARVDFEKVLELSNDPELRETARNLLEATEIPDD